MVNLKCKTLNYETPKNSLTKVTNLTYGMNLEKWSMQRKNEISNY